MKKITIIITITLFLLIGYKYTVNQVVLNSNVLQKEDLVINQLPNLFPSINWSEVKTSSSDTANKPSTYREGVVVVSEMGDNEGVYDSTEFVKKLQLMSWKEMPPDGASGPFTSYRRLSKEIDGVNNILKIVIENSTMATAEIRKSLPSQCPCFNKITIYLER